jgi:hypothetical protein
MIPHAKCHFFDGHVFFEKDKKTPHLKLYTKNVVFLIYRMMPRILGFGG